MSRSVRGPMRSWASARMACLAASRRGCSAAPVGRHRRGLTLGALLVTQALWTGQVAHPQGDRALRDAKLGGDLVVGHALFPQFPRPGPDAILRVRAPGPGRRRLAAQDLVERRIAPDLQDLLDLTPGLAGPAERDRLLAQLW